MKIQNNKKNNIKTEKPQKKHTLNKTKQKIKERESEKK